MLKPEVFATVMDFFSSGDTNDTGKVYHYMGSHTGIGVEVWGHTQE